MSRKDEILRDLASLFDGVDDMADLDAADFKDNAGEIFSLVIRAREVLDEGDTDGE